MSDKRIVVRKYKSGRGYRYIMECLYCGKHFEIKGGFFNRGRGVFCSRSCNASGRGSEKSHLWKGGRHKTKKGYINILHPRFGKGRYVMEHRLVMEKKLGRCLTSKEYVHHLNGVKDDNRPENLILTSSKNHDTYSVRRALQERIRKLEAELFRRDIKDLLK